MVEWQVSQPGSDRFTYHQESASSPLVSWGPDERTSSPGTVCRQAGNTIVCTDIYGEAKPAFRAIFSLQQSMGLVAPFQVARASETEAPPPYYPPGTYLSPSPGQPPQFDPYSFHQGPGSSDRATSPGPVGTGGFDPYSYHQGDKTPVVPVPVPRPGGQEIPLPPIQGPKPGGEPPTTQPQPRPADQPQPRPYSPCQPCQPCRPRWYPGKVAGRVIGRIFGGRCR